MKISGDSEIYYEASDYLSEPRRVANLSGVGAKLDGSIERSRDGITVCHPELEEHTQHVMSLVDQYAFSVEEGRPPMRKRDHTMFCCWKKPVCSRCEATQYTRIERERERHKELYLY